MTLQVDAALVNGHWLVQLGANEQRLMSETQLVAALRAGVLFQGTFVWRPGMSQWLAAANVPELAAALQPRVPPPPPPSAAPHAAARPPRTNAELAVNAAPLASVRVTQLDPRAHVPGGAASFGVLLAPSGAALIMIVLVSCLLALGGVFETQGATPDLAGHER